MRSEFYVVACLKGVDQRCPVLPKSPATVSTGDSKLANLFIRCATNTLRRPLDHARVYPLVPAELACCGRSFTKRPNQWSVLRLDRAKRRQA